MSIKLPTQFNLSYIANIASLEQTAHKNICFTALFLALEDYAFFGNNHLICQMARHNSKDKCSLEMYIEFLRSKIVN